MNKEYDEPWDLPTEEEEFNVAFASALKKGQMLVFTHVENTTEYWIILDQVKGRFCEVYIVNTGLIEFLTHEYISDYALVSKDVDIVDVK